MNVLRFYYHTYRTVGVTLQWLLLLLGRIPLSRVPDYIAYMHMTDCVTVHIIQHMWTHKAAVRQDISKYTTVTVKYQSFELSSFNPGCAYAGGHAMPSLWAAHEARLSQSCEDQVQVRQNLYTVWRELCAGFHQEFSERRALASGIDNPGGRCWKLYVCFDCRRGADLCSGQWQESDPFQQGTAYVVDCEHELLSINLAAVSPHYDVATCLRFAWRWVRAVML